MANKIDDKVEGLGYQWTAEVKKLKELPTSQRLAGRLTLTGYCPHG